MVRLLAAGNKAVGLQHGVEATRMSARWRSLPALVGIYEFFGE
jgi:hypothetical protein